MHYLFNSFQEEFCPTQTILPEGAEDILPTDVEQLRYAVRIDKNKGFIFINNYQDHLVSPDKNDFKLTLSLADEILTIQEKNTMNLASEESCILPFNLTLSELTLKYATTQLITKFAKDDIENYFFFMPQGMKPEYCFADSNISNIEISQGTIIRENNKLFIEPIDTDLSKLVITTASGKMINIYTLTNHQSLNFWKFEIAGNTKVLLSENPILVDNNNIRIEANTNDIIIQTIDEFTDDLLRNDYKIDETDLLKTYKFTKSAKSIPFTTEKIGKGKVLLHIDYTNMREVKEAILNIKYQGDIGYAFVDNELVADNFNNGASWEIGLDNIYRKIPNADIYISISPLKENQVIKSDSPMAARSEEAGKEIVSIDEITIEPIYEFIL